MAGILRELILELGDLKEKVAALEKAVMKEEALTAPVEIHYPILLEGESYANIGRIYNEGYHVCPEAYGQPRSGECLFCIAFLEKE
jgi:regulator of replication initiation timing